MNVLAKLFGVVPYDELKEHICWIFEHPSEYNEYRNVQTRFFDNLSIIHGVTLIDLNKKLSKFFNKRVSLARTYTVILELLESSDIEAIAIQFSEGNQAGIVIYGARQATTEN